tara:strand:+ start:123 stop:656 length:534 start_codon:yes stop_codon:yes gene_type:complete
MNNSLTQEQLKAELNYDQHTGLFTRIRTNTNNVIIGDNSGSISKQGYLNIMVLSTRYLSHRIAWLYEYGNFPTKNIDHINGVKTDNRIINLREATHEENAKNMKMTSLNSSGFLGVCWHKPTESWQVSINTNTNRIYLGIFKKLSDAVKTRVDAEEKYGYHKNHGRKSNQIILEDEL